MIAASYSTGQTGTNAGQRRAARRGPSAEGGPGRKKIQAEWMYDADGNRDKNHLVETYAPLLFEERRVRRAVCSAARGRGERPSSFERQLFAGELEIELVPQGTFSERVRAGGAGIPAFYTPAGVGTPLAEGRETRNFDGRLYLLETSLRADFALIRGHRADRWGNVIFTGSQMNFAHAMATAAQITVVEVDRIEDEPLPPNAIDIPGIYVQRVIALDDER